MYLFWFNPCRSRLRLDRQGALSSWGVPGSPPFPHAHRSSSPAQVKSGKLGKAGQGSAATSCRRRGEIELVECRLNKPESTDKAGVWALGR